MKPMKTTLIHALIVVLCMSLTGTVSLLTAYAGITPKEVDERTKFYQIREGDTLGGLAHKYRSDSRLWIEFERYNIFSNPNLIYPHEELQVPLSWSIPGEERASRKVDLFAHEDAPTLLIEDSVSKAEFDLLRGEVSRFKSALSSTVADLGAEIEGMLVQNGNLKIGIQELQKSSDANSNEIGSLGVAVQANAEKLLSITNQGRGLKVRLDSDLQLLRDAQDSTNRLKLHIESLSVDIESIQEKQGQTELRIESLLEPPPLESNKRTRTFAILTALIGGAAWLAVNAVGAQN